MPFYFGIKSKTASAAENRPKGSRRLLIRRFGRDERGVTAVEMAMVAFPFLFGILAVFETALTFMGTQALQMAVDDVARQIRTGEVHGSAIASRTGFVAAVCDEAFFLFDCEDRLQVDIRTFETYPALRALRGDPPVDENGQFKQDMQFKVGQRNSIVMARAFYKRETIAPVFSRASSVMADGSVLLTAALIFENEPY